ncbi:MAG: GTPase Era [Bacteroidales bacterium]|nr:GTPase Era [Bacteroidales bacterium]
MKKTLHKAGFVNILGKPNVGKSTLMNALVGEKLSIITSKAQTTRHRIMGIVNGDDFQIVYSDTPGILKPNYKLQESMMNFIHTALIDADVFIYVVEIGEESIDEEVLQKMNSSNIPVLLLINKIDLSDQKTLEKKVELFKSQFLNAEIIPVSALKKFNVEYVFDRILDKLPESPPFFPKDEISDKSQRFFVSEIIREKILLFFQKEIPYSAEVVVDAFKEEKDIIKIRAIIYVIRDSQKAIVIGHKGKAIKKIGTEARKDIEEFFENKVYLDLTVKVNKNWRDSIKELRRFGYEN